MNFKALFAILLALLAVETTQACRMFGLPISQANANEYIFIGTVKGYGDARLTGEVDTKRFIRDTASTIIIEVDQRVYTASEENTFDVIPMRYHADCRFSGSDRVEAEKKFPIGSKVRVIARKATYFEDATKNKNSRILLESPPVSNSGIWQNIGNNGKEMTSASSVFDYSLAYDNTNEQQEVRALPLFEIRKDLWRLERSKDQKARDNILARMILYPRYDPLFIDFKIVLKRFTSSESEHLRYLQLREERLKTVVVQ